MIFTSISVAEMAALPKQLQLDLLTEFHLMPEDLDNLDASRFGHVQRDGRKLLRYRARDYRIYFEKHPAGVLIHRVFHKNTIRDFLYRSTSSMDHEETEDEQLGSAKEFWKHIEEAEKKA